MCNAFIYAYCLRILIHNAFFDVQFMYAMPLRQLDDGTHLCFFEETSLVGIGSRRLSFEECKKRAYKRLAYHKVSVLGVEEEEYCYIPMGGELPSLEQRVVGENACMCLSMCVCMHLCIYIYICVRMFLV